MRAPALWRVQLTLATPSMHSRQLVTPDNDFADTLSPQHVDVSARRSRQRIHRVLFALEMVNR